MALPTIVINNSTGSNTQASGAGPATAVFGTGCNTTNGSSTITISDAVALGGVAVDGSAVLYVAASGGRKFSKITAISGSSGAWTLTVQDTVWGGGTGQSWAIGGKRLDFETGNSDTKQAFSDFYAGWKFDIQGTTYTNTSKIIVAAVDAGSTSLPLIITSTNAAASAPTITTATNSTSLFSIEPTVSGNGNLQISNINLTNTATTKSPVIVAASNNIASNSLLVQDCLLDMNATTGAAHAIDFSNRPPTYIRIFHNTIRNFMGWGINAMDGDCYGNTFLGATGCLGGVTVSNDSGLAIHFFNNAFNNCTTGFSNTDPGHGSGNVSFYSNSFRGGTTGISIAKGATTNNTLLFTNNAFWNMTTGISITTGNTAAQYANLCGAWGNSFGSVTTTITASTVPIYAAGPTISADPWPSAASGDFRAAAGSTIQSAGYPNSPVGYTSIINGDDIGAVGHAASGGGGGILYLAGMQGGMQG